ncbi:chromate transporter [Ktedonobacter racemifer]|uniref:Chromate transporter n=1 Tax=Ktedonobacter racemifer DSM 44963 TaxID=485913 RepID=D6TP35_KTERA|nr:chromate transporter [Ktedonobacter racemifer]EFH87391.1 Chromate transporter [Ktedonobacter racemifer DSM 44963]
MQTQAPPFATTLPPSLRPSTWKLLRLWTLIGLQSFGGGSSTSYLIQNIFIDKYHYLTIEEYMHYWNLCIFTPGINLVALTILIGRKLGGIRGILVSLVGMLVPSAAVTCLLTAIFTLIQGNAIVQAVMRGVVPATAGLMLLVGLRFAQPLFKQAQAEGSKTLIVSTILVLACAATIILLEVSVIPVLLCTALLSMLFFTPWRTKANPTTLQQATEASRAEGEEK